MSLDIDVNERLLGRQQLIVEIFWLAVHDIRYDSGEHARSAREFLSSEWAEYLAALVGIPIAEVRRRVAAGTRVNGSSATGRPSRRRHRRAPLAARRMEGSVRGGQR